MEAVVLIPGFFGFGQFGSPPGRVIEYFAGVKQALARAEPSLEGRIVVHVPPPTGSIAERVESLHVAIEKLLAGEPLPHNPPLPAADSVRLVGHSAGGVDARLVAHPGYTWPRGPTGSERERVRDAIRRVVTLSSPHRGTPIATGEQKDFHALILAVTAVSIFGMGRFSLLTPLSTMITAIGHFAPDALRALSTDPVLGLVSGVDSDAAHEIEGYFDELASDQRLMDDLTVSSMGRLEAALSSRDRVPVDCFVSSSPAPGFGISHPLGRFLYKRLYAATAKAIVPGPSPSGPIVDGSAPPFPLGQHASDGVVPVTSQTLDGHAAGIVFGDHEDVIGHFSGGPGTTVFKSDSNFDVSRFQALWADIARRLV